MHVARHHRGQLACPARGASPNNGPPPTTLPGGMWGQEKEVTRIDRMATNFYLGGTNFTDWYYPALRPRA